MEYESRRIYPTHEGGILSVKTAPIAAIFTALAFGAFVVPQPQAQTPPVLAIGTLDQSRAGSFVDLSGFTYNLERKHDSEPQPVLRLLVH
jgi:hypothetical protein